MSDSIKIVHIADIHWRGLTRHDEYRETFERFFEEIPKLNPDVIYLGGDIVHSKTQGISPELIDHLVWWFKEMSKICPVHVILGNHDGIMHNKDRQDAISPIINAMGDSNIKLYKDSGVYPTGVPGFNWCVFSCFDEPGWKDLNPPKGDVNIALFHGAVRGSLTDIDWSIEGEVDVSIFDKFDFALLGDIHKVQFLTEDKRVAYSGSTIQQNYGESNNKGFLFWDIRSKDDFDVEFHKIPAARPFVTIEWAGSVRETLDEIDEEYPKGSRFRVRSADSIPHVESSQLQNELRLLFDAHEVVFKDDQEMSANSISTESVSMLKTDLRDLDVHMSLLREFLGNDRFTKKEWRMVKEMMKEYLRRASGSDVAARNIKWSIEKFAFDNLFCYGDGNVIDLTKMSGITGIFARNASGKSSIPATLMYSLFNTTDRGPIKNIHVINARKNHCAASVDLKIKSDNYRINRKTNIYENRRGIRHATTTLGFSKLDASGNIVTDLSGEQRTKTEQIIRKMIGTSDDFLLTSFSAQGDMNAFIREGSTFRKRILAKFLDLEIFERMYEYAKNDSGYIKSQIKNAPDRDWSSLIEENTKLRGQLTRRMKHRESTLEKKRVELQRLVNDLESMVGEDGGFTVWDVKKQERVIFDANVALEKRKKELISTTEEMTELQLRLKKIEDVTLTFPIEEIRGKIKEQEDIQSALRDIRHQHEREFDDLKKKEESIKLLGEVPCGDSFPTCKFIKRSHEDKQTIDEKRENVENLLERIDDLEKSFDRLSDQNLNDKIEKYDALLRKGQDINLEVSKKSIEIDRLDFDIESLSDKIADLNDDLSEMRRKMSDDDSSEELINLKERIATLSDEINRIDSERMSAAEQRGSTITVIENLRKEKEQYSELRSKWKIYESIIQAVSKRGIPSQIISSQLPIINAEIEKILNGVVDFTVELQVDTSSSSTDVFINYGDSKRIIELASGMEKMISSLAIRVALLNVSSLPKTDILIIDEGFGTLDENNIEACSQLLQSLKKWFKNILVITHVDAIKDVADNVLEISKSGKDSKVVFN